MHNIKYLKFAKRNKFSLKNLLSVILFFIIISFLNSCGTTSGPTEQNTQSKTPAKYWDPQINDILWEKYISAMKLVGDEKYEKAIDAFKALIHGYPKFNRSYYKAVEVYWYMDKLDECLTFFEELAGNEQHAGFAQWAMGRAYYKQNKCEEAIEKFTEAYEIIPDLYIIYTDFILAYYRLYGKVTAFEKVEAFLLSLKEKNPGNSKILMGLGFLYLDNAKYEKALTHLTESIAMNPEFPIAYEYRGYIYERLNRPKEALVEMKIEKHILAAANDVEYLSTTNLALGRLYSTLGEYNNAMKSYKLSYEDAAIIGNRRTGLGAKYSLGWISANVYGEEIDAISYYKETEKLGRELDYPGVEINSMINIARAYSDLYDYRTALSYYDKALDKTRDLQLQDRESEIYTQLGDLYGELGDPQAREYFEKALSIDIENKNRESEAFNYNHLGDYFYQRGKYAEAIDYYNRSLDIGREIQDISIKFWALINLGYSYMKMGDYGKTEKCYSEAFSYAEKTGHMLWKAWSLMLKGLINIARQNFLEAEKCGHELLNIIQKRKYNELIIDTYTLLSKACFGQEKFREALRYQEKAIARVESGFQTIDSDENRAGFMGEQNELFEDYITQQIRLYEKEPDKSTYHIKAFNSVERFKSRALLKLLEEAKVNIRLEPKNELLRKDHTLNKEYSFLFTEYQELISTPNQELDATQKEMIIKFEIRLKEIEEELEKVKIDIHKANPVYARLVYPKTVTLEKLQKEILDSSSILLEYKVTEKAVFLWKVTKNKIQFYRLPFSRQQISEEVEYFRKSIDGMVNSKVFVKHAYSLYEKLVATALSPGDKEKRLLIVPDDVLNGVPFEALVVSMPDDRDTSYSHFNYLIQRHPVQYVSSASVLSYLPEPSVHYDKEFLGFGDPLFGTNEVLEKNAYIRSALGQTALRNLKRLEFSGQEVENIGKLFPEGEVYTREKALEESLKPPFTLDQYRYIHFATHGIINEEKPQFSGIVLTQDKDPREDGFLRMQEIYQLNLKAELVVLSACRTGLGRLVKGEGFMGLSRAFMYAGTPSLLVSMWNVEDESTAILMTEFYRQLKKGPDKAAALREAKLLLLQESGGNSNRYGFYPKQWASFILIGKH